MPYSIIKMKDGENVYSPKTPEEVVKEINENKLFETTKGRYTSSRVYKIYNHQKDL